MSEMNDQIHKPRKGTGLRPRGQRLAAAVAAAVLILSGLAFCVPVRPVYASQTPPVQAASETGVRAAQAGTARIEAASAAQDPVSMEVLYGYDNMAKGGRYLPVEVTIGNRQGQVLAGELQIKARESDGTIYRYDYRVSVEPSSEAVMSYYIPLGTNANQLFLSLVDEADNVILNKRVKLNVSRDVPELFIGLLSDETWNLEYLDGVGINYSTLRTRAFEMEETEFPEDEMGLSLLDVLVVNNYKLRNLSEKQTAAIMDWVHSGGLLILGTGDRVDDTLGRFAPELLDDSYGTPNLRHIDLGEGFSLEEPSDGMLAIPCVDIPLHGGNVILSSSGFPLLTAAAKEQGMIAVAAFDLGNLSEFGQKHPAYVDHIFTNLLGETRINQLAEVVYSGNSGKFWSVQSLINTGNVDKLPNLLLYVGIVTVYLVLLGPGLYLSLKNREMQIYYRRGVLALSLIFAAVIYLMGTTTRFRSTFYTYATIQDVTDDYLTDTTYINIRNPYNRPYTVELNPEYSVLPITRSFYNEAEDGDFSGDEPYQIAIRKEGERTVIQGQNTAAFAPRYFQLERKSDNTDRVGIVGEVDYFEGDLHGSLTNQFPFPLENTTLILYGNMVQIGRMEPGETKNLEEFSLLRFPLGNSYVVADRISGESLFHRTDINDKGYLLAMERSNLLKFYLDNYMNGYSADARVIAFSTDKEENQFLNTPSAETYGLTMLTASVAVNASRDRSLYRSVLMKAPKVVSGSYEELTNSMSGSDPLTLEYQLGTDITVESLTFESVSEEFLESSGNRFIEAFSGNIYFYNYGSGNYDEVALEGRTMNVDQLKSYLSPGNTLTVRYVNNGVSGYNAIQLPMPMVAGRER